MNGVSKVVVSLNQGIASVELRPENQFDLFSLPEKIRANGFTAGDIEVTAKGTLTMVKGQPALKVSGRNDLVFLLQSPGKGPRPAGGGPVLVTGKIAAFQHRVKTEPLSLSVERIESAG